MIAIDNCLTQLVIMHNTCVITIVLSYFITAGTIYELCLYHVTFVGLIKFTLFHIQVILDYTHNPLMSHIIFIKDQIYNYFEKLK